jgi:hypothetical protein
VESARGSKDVEIAAENHKIVADRTIVNGHLETAPGAAGLGRDAAIPSIGDPSFGARPRHVVA